MDDIQTKRDAVVEAAKRLTSISDQSLASNWVRDFQSRLKGAVRDLEKAEEQAEIESYAPWSFDTSPAGSAYPRTIAFEGEPVIDVWDGPMHPSKMIHILNHIERRIKALEPIQSS